MMQALRHSPVLNGTIAPDNAAPRTQEGAYLLLPSLRQLVHAGYRITLAPKSFMVVQYLFQNQDRTVSKEELLRELWPCGSGEHALRQEIFALRNRLKEHGADGCIVTVSKLGYRFDPRGKSASAPPVFGHHLSNQVKRSLAIATFLEQRCDWTNLGKALRWYQRVCVSDPDNLAGHLGSVRCLLALAQRSAIPVSLAMQHIRSHLARVSYFGSYEREAIALEHSVNALLLGDVSAMESLAVLNQGDPGNSKILQVLASIDLMQGRAQQALERLNRAIEIDPVRLDLYADHACVLCHSGDLAGAKEELTFLKLLNADHPDFLERLAIACTLGGQLDEAVSLLGDVKNLSASGKSTLCVALAKKGDLVAATQVFEELHNERQHRYVSSYYIAKCLIALGDAEKCIEALRATTGEPLGRALRTNPWFGALRTDARFEALCQNRDVA